MQLIDSMVCFLVVEGPSVEPSIGDEIVLTSRHEVIEITIFQFVVDQFKGNIFFSGDDEPTLVIFSPKLSFLEHINEPRQADRKLSNVGVSLEELSFIFNKIDKLILIHEIPLEIVLVKFEENVVEDGRLTLYDSCVFDDKLSKFDIWFEVIVEVGKQTPMHLLT